MSRKKSDKRVVPWLSAKADPQEGRFIQVGNSLLLSDSFQALPVGAQHLYLCMAMEAGGQREFKFPERAFKKYGISSRTGRTHINALIDGGFIYRAADYHQIRKETVYAFSEKWKSTVILEKFDTAAKSIADDRRRDAAPSGYM